MDGVGYIDAARIGERERWMYLDAFLWGKGGRGSDVIRRDLIRRLGMVRGIRVGAEREA